jgi:hypothetical protein
MISHALFVFSLVAQPSAELENISLASEVYCVETMRAYVRFFAACEGCPELEDALKRHTLAFLHCTQDANPNDKLNVDQLATRPEILELLRRLRPTEPRAASEMFIALMDSNNAQETLDALRIRAFMLLAPGGLADIAPFDSFLMRVYFRLRSSQKCGSDIFPDYGYLTVGSTPWGQVYVNGKHVGTTPISRLRVPAGCTMLRVVNPATGKEIEREIEIEPNKVQIFRFELDE